MNVAAQPLPWIFITETATQAVAVPSGGALEVGWAAPLRAEKLAQHSATASPMLVLSGERRRLAAAAANDLGTEVLA